MDDKRILTVLRSILAQPTAPFHEFSVREAIWGFLDGHPDIRLELDGFGNLLAYYSASGAPPRWAFGSHMDHPGWVRSVPEGIPGVAVSNPLRQRDGFTFLGGVPDQYFEAVPPPPIKEFGDLAMWDLVDFKRENGVISSRACDDLVGCAAIVTAMLELQENQVPTSVVGIFTRAEEVGFVGAIELGRDWPLPKECVFVSVETSIPTDNARMGRGPMCRVGDRLSIFDNDATATMLAVAEDHELPIQRALLDRGSCEATALQAYGIKTAGVSLPLGNYHNCGELSRIRPEYIMFRDLRNLVSLLGKLATDCPDGPRDIGAAQRKHFEARAASYMAYDPGELV